MARRGALELLGTLASGRFPLTEGPSMTSAVAPVTLRTAARQDWFRQTAVTLAGLFLLVAALIDAGTISIPRRPATPPAVGLLTPSPIADRVWLVIDVALLVYVVWQWLPFAGSSRRARLTGYPVATALVAKALWLITALIGWSLVSILLMVGFAASLAWVLTAGTRAAAGFAVRQITQVPFALSLGWTVILIGSAVGSLGFSAPFLSSEVWGVLGVTGLLGLGMALVRYFRGRVFIAASMAWGFVWIAHARLLGGQRAYGVAVVSIVAAGLILIAGLAVFLWARARVRERVPRPTGTLVLDDLGPGVDETEQH